MTNPSTALARRVVAELAAAGVTEIVVAPGSRNAPLSFAAFDAARAGLVRLHTRIDERSAGFLAVGLTRTGSRAAVVTTSGTAVANLHPAVLEAAHAALPLVVVSADRPARLRGTHANQTTDQVGIFTPLVTTLDLPDDALVLDSDGPTHLNVRFDEPLMPDDRWAPRLPEVEEGALAGGPEVEEGALAGGPEVEEGALAGVPEVEEGALAGVPEVEEGALAPVTRPDPTTLAPGPRTVVVAGDEAGPPARELAERAGWPLLAEPTSGARTGNHALRCYRLLLDTDLGRAIERVVVFGHPTLSRPVSRLLSRSDVEVLAVRPRGVWSESPFPATEISSPEAEPDDPAWLESWQAADASVARQLDALLAAEGDLTPYAVAGAVSRAVPASGLLVVGASSPIRDLDLMVARYAVGERRKVIANRGLAGIDGTVSTAIGAALGRPHSTRALALVGDVTFLHDANGLVLGPDEPRPDLTLVVVNDDGGSIFSMLEQGAEQYSDRYDALFGTPHGVDVAALCAATRTPHWQVDSLPELEHALASPNGGIEVIEARVRRDNRRELDERIRALRP